MRKSKTDQVVLEEPTISKAGQKFQQQKQIYSTQHILSGKSCSDIEDIPYPQHDFSQVLLKASSNQDEFNKFNQNDQMYESYQDKSKQRSYSIPSKKNSISQQINENQDGLYKINNNNKNSFSRHQEISISQNNFSNNKILEEIQNKQDEYLKGKSEISSSKSSEEESDENEDVVDDIMVKKIDNHIAFPNEEVLFQQTKALKMKSQNNSQRKSIQQLFQTQFGGENNNTMNKQGKRFEELAQNMKIATIIDNFRNKYIKYTTYYKFPKLKKLNRDIIKDKSSHFSFSQKIQDKTCFSKFKQKMLPYIDKIIVFYPGSKWILFIDFIVLVYLTFQIYLLPLRFAFSQKELDSKNYNYEEISTVIQGLHILICMNTGIYQEGQINMSRSAILQNYAKSQLWIDIFSLVAVFIDNDYFKCLFLLQIGHLQNTLYTIDENLQIQQRFPTIYSLVKLFLMTFFVAHYCACGYLVVQQVDRDKEGWMEAAEIQASNWEVKYLYSLYFVFITMSTIGYGDISPKTNTEKIYGLIVTLIACGVFAFCVNMIGSIFQEKETREFEYKQKRYHIIKFMEARNVSKVVQYKVLRYLQYQHQLETQGVNIQKGLKVLKNISQTISQEVYKEYYTEILYSSTVLKQYFSNEFIEELSLYLQEKTLTPGELLLKEGSIDSNLYFINKGELEIFEYQPKITILENIQQGNFIGYRNFFIQNQPHENNCRSKGMTSLIYIEYDQFIKLLQQYPRQYEIYAYIREQYLNNDLIKTLDKKCIYCNAYDHTKENCTLLHLVINRHFTVLKFDNSCLQNRKMYYRGRRGKSLDSLYQYQNYRKQVLKIRLDNILALIKDHDYLECVYDILDIIEEDDDYGFLNLVPSILHLKEERQPLKIYVQPFDIYCKDIEIFQEQTFSDFSENEKKGNKTIVEEDSQNSQNSDHSKKTSISENETDHQSLNFVKRETYIQRKQNSDEINSQSALNASNQQQSQTNIQLTKTQNRSSFTCVSQNQQQNQQQNQTQLQSQSSEYNNLAFNLNYTQQSEQYSPKKRQNSVSQSNNILIHNSPFQNNNSQQNNLINQESQIEDEQQMQSYNNTDVQTVMTKKTTKTTNTAAVNKKQKNNPRQAKQARRQTIINFMNKKQAVQPNNNQNSGNKNFTKQKSTVSQAYNSDQNKAIKFTYIGPKATTTDLKKTKTIASRMQYNSMQSNISSKTLNNQKRNSKNSSNKGFVKILQNALKSALQPQQIPQQIDINEVYLQQKQLSQQLQQQQQLQLNAQQNVIVKDIEELEFEEDNIFRMMKFDIQKQYVAYRPQNNLKVVLQLFKAYQQKKTIVKNKNKKTINSRAINSRINQQKRESQLHTQKYRSYASKKNSIIQNPNLVPEKKQSIFKSLKLESSNQLISASKNNSQAKNKNKKTNDNSQNLENNENKSQKSVNSKKKN